MQWLKEQTTDRLYMNEIHNLKKKNYWMKEARNKKCILL